LASTACAYHARHDDDDVPSVFDRARQPQRVLPDCVGLEVDLLFERDITLRRQVAGAVALVQSRAMFAFIDARCSTFGWEALGRGAASSCRISPLPSPPHCHCFRILQAAAASRIKGKPDIFNAAESGNLSLVRDHIIADPSCVDRRDV
jgi:hypothetical protein